MREIAELFLREAVARPNCPEAVIAHRISGVSCLYFGDFAGAHDHLQKTTELYDKARHADFANRFGSDPRAAAEILDAIILWVLGRIDDALPLAERALAHAKASAHPPTMGHALLFAAVLGLVRCDTEASRPTAKRWPLSCLDMISQPSWPALRYFFRAGQSRPTAPKTRDPPRCDAASASLAS